MVSRIDDLKNVLPQIRHTGFLPTWITVTPLPFNDANHNFQIFISALSFHDSLIILGIE
ncbi:hypothetical protein Lalb_Chr04g0264391 [Lupinus albus]|uniref:Uncharacterized protein n=1 Tax=Lupinus albus TaxID=3870 RepID=A0A6A4QNN2_LUPAL|nr:hypothetical protein Lalb_Chr04g0264391 [Lupinus albus]